MSQDEQGPRLRERVWLEKWDKTVDPPRLIEEIFVEDGRVISRRAPVVEPVEPEGDLEDRHAVR